MDIEIFDVEHGGCSLVTADNNRRILVDCGHNTTTNWRPSQALPARGIEYIDRLIVSNYDRDHVSDLPGVLANIGVPVLSRNPSVSPNLLHVMKAENGMDQGIRAHQAARWAQGGDSGGSRRQDAGARRADSDGAVEGVSLATPDR